MTDTSKKIDRAIRLIKAYSRHCNPVLAYSGGKDSDVVNCLFKLAHVKVDLVYNSTTIDYPGVISHCIENGASIRRPKYTFLQLIAKKGLPSMTRRFCCSELKEQFIPGTVFFGIRSDESVKRTKRYTEPTACRIYSKKKWQEQVFPLLDWVLEDEQYLIENEGIKLHESYIGENGHYDLSRRVGCIGCPLQGDRGKRDFLQYPKFLRLWVKAYAEYVRTHKAVESVYHDIVWHLFYSNHGNNKYNQTYHGLFEPPDPRQFLCDYFNIDL